jgi:GGDEF domain-containing protein
MADNLNPQAGAKKAFSRLSEFITSNFLRLNIANKLMLGFSSLLVLLVIISVYALMNLNRLNAINSSILQSDLPVILVSEKMIDGIFAQELYTRRYMVFRTTDVMDIFLYKKKVFENLINRVKSVPEKNNFPVAKIALLHNQYINLLLDGIKSTDTPSSLMSTEFEDKIKAHQEKFLAAVREMAAVAQQDQNEKTAMTADIGTFAFKAAKVLCGLGLILSLAAAMLITRNISGAIKKLKFATEMIANGEFNHKPDIRNTDELGDLSKAFVTMARQLKNQEEMNLDTSPLTKLPGGTTIENVMNKRISAQEQIAFCLLDIDNFKAYNDHYGYAKGNEIIQATADIVSKAVADHGSEDDFVGHIGGDDYVVITTLDSYRNICQAIVDTFDNTIPGFYDPQDRKRGHINGEDRQGNKATFPLASVSIAVVTNEKRKSLNHIQFGEAAAEMKELAKSEPGSLFLVDQRGAERGSRIDRKVTNIQSGESGSQKTASKAQKTAPKAKKKASKGKRKASKKKLKASKGKRKALKDIINGQINADNENRFRFGNSFFSDRVRTYSRMVKSQIRVSKHED